MLALLPEEERFESWHLVRSDGSLAGGRRGNLALLRELAPVPAVPGLARAVDAVYWRLARNRDRLGKLVPGRPGPRRFP
ncbi:MAG: hypothetical protein H0V68_01010 [Actinobacteria bacterium]|nr:hypothetical protein [Actinomycetota bacterium]